MSINMLSKGKRLLIGIPLVLVIFAVLLIALIWWMDNGAKRRTSTAETEITLVEPQTWRGSKNRTESGYRISYRFTTETGETIQKVEERNTSYKKGTPYHVCYDPKNPSDSSLHATNGSECGKGLLF